jgi:hypothetical protein
LSTTALSPPQSYEKVSLKGQYREILHLHFFHQKYTPWTLIHILSFFRIFSQKFVELLELKFNSLLHDAAGSQISPQHYEVGSQTSPLHFAAGSQISLLHDAAGSQVNDCCRNLSAA